MTKAIETAVRMLESLPEEVQARVVERLRDLVEDMRDEDRWGQLFEQRMQGLVAAARKARADIAAGKAKDMDDTKL